MDASKIHLISPSLQLVAGSSIQKNNPSGMLVGDSTANPPGMTTPFLTVGPVNSTVKRFLIMYYLKMGRKFCLRLVTYQKFHLSTQI